MSRTFVTEVPTVSSGHQRTLEALSWMCLVDTRLAGAPAGGRALNLDDLFLELNA